MLTDEQSKALIDTVKRAFAPLNCVAEVWDYGDKFRFQVVDADGTPLVSAASIPLHDLADPRTRRDLLHFARCRIEAKGFRLAPFPER